MKVHYHVRMWGYFETENIGALLLRTADSPKDIYNYGFRLCS